MLPRDPSPHQWRLFDTYATTPEPLTPQQFLSRWSLSYAELSQLVGVSRSTVERWFLHPGARRQPSAHCCRRLAEIDVLWQKASMLSVQDLKRYRSADVDISQH